MPSGPDRPIRVMVADDYLGMHRALVRLLTPECEVVGSVIDGSRVLDEASRLQPDVVVLDLGMTGSNGLEMCQQLRVLCPGLPVIIYSAHHTAWVQRRALEAGATAFVPKNRIDDDLLPAIRQAVNAAGSG